MEAGKLWHEIAIQERLDTRDTYGASVKNFQTAFNTYAELKNLSGSELIQAQQINSRITTQFKIRWNEELRATHRIKYKNRFYGILWINNVDERDKEMILLCERLEDVTNG